MKRILFIIPAICLLASSPLMSHEAGHSSADEMSEAATAWLGTLQPEQLKTAKHALTATERENWNFLPTRSLKNQMRHGLVLKSMRADQRHLAYALLSSGLSHKGFLNANQIMALEYVLWEMENNADHRDTLDYYLTIFGDPNSENWGWRFEGHHLSLNFTIADGNLVSGTPNFFASNPGVILKGPQKGLQVLASEENVARSLITSLSKAQQEIAIFSEKPPKEILTRFDKTVKPLEEAGISWKELTPEQQQQLIKLIGVYVHRLRTDFAKDELAEIKTAGFENIRFAWAGGLEHGEGHYYRVQGPTFLLEYANTQNDARHVHAVWRDFNGDFGRDLLKEHYNTKH